MRANRWIDVPYDPPEGEEIAEAEAQAGLALVIGLLIVVIVAVGRMLGLL